ncbi:Outer membrane protein assembly factor BamD, BamD/ComL family [Nonomuraea maritima]|uniref:Outer membrane protein assembly factor BamD, BamD/ComL family n=1 Tax=Nonomuraea maritima TaxID=683260 RepID=A0A1G9NM43_9ACTN|nr:tetratricopeptide repeat protein [Nonomuraea maritima]SDL87440.1 Outer membrane protein assembly factor BamD, BamD/ComL family [Nonomuraea maritima]
MRTDASSTDDDPSDRSSREWCEEALTRLNAGRLEPALEAARRAAGLDPGAEWPQRLLSLVHERLGRDADALPFAERAVRLAPGSWPARLRLAAALRRTPGRWADAEGHGELARRFAPELAGPEVLLGDLALLRGDHRGAARRYRAALARDPGHPQARVNLGLALLRWERPRPHHDPAWPIDPRETGRARRALEVWSRQARLLVAVATLAVGTCALLLGVGAEARLGGLAVLVVLVPLTVRHARRVEVLSYVPAMFRRDPWLGAGVASAAVAVAAYTAWLLLGAEPDDPVGAGLAGIAVLSWPALAAVRTPAEVWRGRPLRALAALSALAPEAEGAAARAARRNAGVMLWMVLGRTWSVLVAVAAGALVVDPRAAVAVVAVPYPMVRGYLRARHRGDVPLRAATVLVVLAAPACAAGGLLGSAWAWRAGFGALALVVPVFVVRAARAWWRGGPGPWRSSLLMCDLPVGGEPSVALDAEVRRAFSAARGVVLSYGGPLGPRAVGAVASVTSSGELRLIAGAEAWDAVEADPRVAVFAGDPPRLRLWAEVSGVALADAGVLRVTPKQVRVGEFPGRHQRPG